VGVKKKKKKKQLINLQLEPLCMVVKQTEMSKETILELKITRKKKIFSHHFMTISQFLLKSKIILIKVNFYIFLKNKM